MEAELRRPADGADRGLLETLIGDGRSLLHLTGLSLILAGLFALFLSATGRFLPHDVEFLGMEARDLCTLHGCRIVHFMFHDRVAFGGAIIAVGILYLWLAAFPIREGQAWAWWLFALSGVTGFGSFLSYLGTGYLDSWHGVATLGLLGLFAGGLIRTYPLLAPPRSGRGLLKPAGGRSLGTWFLLATAAGMVAGGGSILAIGTTSVFVPTDLQFMGVTVEELRTLNPRLVPLIAHDRAGFGGGILTCGLLVLGCVWCGRPSKSLWQALALAGTCGFGCAIGVHFRVGYTDVLHLLPAVTGSGLFLAGLILSRRSMIARTGSGASA
jgi:hypothetical protein